jgi:G3E family GTPase
MDSSRRNDTEPMSVSIVAGPSVATLLDSIGTARTGLLTSTKDRSSNGLKIFAQAPDSQPDQIANDIRSIAEKGAVEHLIIECEPDRPPMACASLFLPRDNSRESLTALARLTATVFAIDSANLLRALIDREPDSVSTCFMVEQMEFVSDIFLEGASGENLHLATSIARSLNPRAHVLPLTSTAVETWRRPRTSLFDFDAALNGAGWRRLIDDEQSTPVADNKITAFAYRARRPFHPDRFVSLLQKELRGVFRAKGFFWLATRMDQVGGLNLAGAELHCASAGAWWAARDEHVRESEMPERTRTEWEEPFGDRRQAFAVMAYDRDRNLLQSQFDACLLTDAEMAEGQDSWKNFVDPFPSWSENAHAHHHHDHECDHHHGSEEHDCCHH